MNEEENKKDIMDEEDKNTDSLDDTRDDSAESDVVEFVYNDDGEEDIKATLKKLRKDLKDVRKEKEEYLTSWQRERADFQNYKKDELVRLNRAKDYAKETFIDELLPVLDAYDLAFANREAWEKVDKNWRTGVEYIHQQLIKVLSDSGVTEISPNVGDELDHNLHEALETVDGEEKNSGKIASVTQKGYRTAEKVIRPARVKVYK